MSGTANRIGRILVAEDGDAHARIIQAVLQRAGFEVTRVGNGLEAFDAIEKGMKPDLLITDILMPGLSGFELLAKLQNAGLSVPTIVLTGKQDEENVMRGLNFGALDYISKPFSPTELLARVKIALKKSEAS